MRYGDIYFKSANRFLDVDSPSVKNNQASFSRSKNVELLGGITVSYQWAKYAKLMVCGKIH